MAVTACIPALPVVAVARGRPAMAVAARNTSPLRRVVARARRSDKRVPVVGRDADPADLETQRLPEVISSCRSQVSTTAVVVAAALLGANFADAPPSDAATASLWDLSLQPSAGLEAAAAALTLASTAYTLLFSGRFLLSCFPQLERKRKEMPWVVLTASTDPILEPIRPVFAQNKQRLEGMDVAAVVGLTSLSIFQEVLFGGDGIMLSAVPYAMAQDYLELLLLLQRGFCLPMWLLLVFRIINYI